MMVFVAKALWGKRWTTMGVLALIGLGGSATWAQDASPTPLPVETQAQTWVEPRSLTIDSRFFFDAYSNDAILRFGAELTDLTHWPVERLLPLQPSDGKGFLQWGKPGVRNLLNGLASFVAGAYVGSAFGHAFHEFGHGSRVAAVGFKPWYTHDAPRLDSGGGPIRAGGSDGFFGYLGSSLGDRSGFTLARLDRTRFPLNQAVLANGWDGLNAMSGLNNEMEYASALDEQMQRRPGHLGLLAPYLAGKLAPRTYESGVGLLNDMSNILAFYKAQRIDVSLDDIRRGSTVAVWGSGNTYRLAFTALRTLTGRRPEFEPMTIGPLELPATAFLLNREGLSYRVGTAVHVGSVRIPVAVERVYRGVTRTEWTLGVDGHAGRFSGSTRFIVGEQVEGTLNVRRQIGQRVVLEVGIASYDQRNLNGARRISRLESGDRQTQAHAAISWVFQR